jgi:hypothetical protein
LVFHVEIPSSEYNGHIPATPVSKGIKPIKPHHVLGPITTSASNPAPITTLMTRSTPFSFTKRMRPIVYNLLPGPFRFVTTEKDNV